MARFTDQFRRYKRRTFQPSLLLPTWPKLAQMDANAILSDASDEEVADLARLIDQEIGNFADPARFRTRDTNRAIWTRERREWVDPGGLKSRESIRDTFCDLNILLVPLDERNPLVGTRFENRFNTWHLLAVLALWKLIDGRDAIGNSTEGLVPSRATLSPVALQAIRFRAMSLVACPGIPNVLEGWLRTGPCQNSLQLEDLGNLPHT